MTSAKMLLPKLQTETDIELLPIGQYIDLDNEGYLKNHSNLQKLPAKWLQALTEMKTAYIKHEKDFIHSIYIRGSVARGEPIENVSDIDTVAVVNEKGEDLDTTWIKGPVKYLNSKYPFVTGFEFVHWNIQDLQDIKKGRSNRFNMKTQYACIYGEDLIETFDKVKPTNEFAKLLTTKFKDSLASGLNKLAERKNTEDIANASVWLAKRFLRAGFFLVMPKEQKLTKDLYPSYESFSKYYPNKRDEMYTVLYLALNPKSQKTELIKFYTEFGNWLGEEIGKTYANFY